MAEIIIGSPAINRDESYAIETIINKNNPADASGKITSIEIFAFFDQNLVNCEVATFFVVSGNFLSTRATHSIGAVTAGSKQTFPGLNLTVGTGDYIGIYYTAGAMEVDNSGGVGIWHIGGDQIPCTNKEFSLLNGWNISLYGTGETVGVAVAKKNVIFMGSNL